MSTPTPLTYDAQALIAGYSGVTISLILSCLGAGIGSYRTFTGISNLSLSKPTLIIKAMIPIVMSGVIAIYGLIISVIISGKSNKIKYTLNAKLLSA